MGSKHKPSLLTAAALVILGLVIGSGSTLLWHAWRTASTAEAPAASEPPAKPALTTDLLLTGEPSLGREDAPLTIVEFSDFECSYCKRFHDQVLPQLKREYINTGLVRFVHKDLPLPFHGQALPAAAAARCAGKQNRYWDVYDAIFDQQNCLECKGVGTIAASQDLDRDQLNACMQEDSIKAVINTNLSEAKLHNIRATPTFVIGPTQTDGTHRGEIIEGAVPWPQFKALIDQELNRRP